MGVTTWIMVLVCAAWLVLFLAFTARDLKSESRKREALAAGEEIDPFLFSGEKARQEAREMYLRDAQARNYFDEQGITPFLNLPPESGQEG